MKENTENSRRNFIKKVAGAALAAGAAPTVLWAGENGKISSMIPYRKPIAANDHIQLALIGGGIQGTSDMQSALKVPGVKLMAVSDVYDGRLVRAKELYGH